MSDFDLEYHLRAIAISYGPLASDEYDGDKSAKAVTDEFAKLREAVRVLGEVGAAATSDAEENFYTNIRRAMVKVLTNPIAAAAISKGPQHGPG
jgi:hypothetical protein